MAEGGSNSMNQQRVIASFERAQPAQRQRSLAFKRVADRSLKHTAAKAGSQGSVLHSTK